VRTDTPTPCIGQHALFDSTDPAAHLRAKALCDACPLTEACRLEFYAVRAEYPLSKSTGPQGTWAGMLIDPDPRSRRNGRNPSLGTCGTASGRREHVRAHTAICEPCRVAWNAYKREWHARKEQEGAA
jgi:hypothetical protein